MKRWLRKASHRKGTGKVGCKRCAGCVGRGGCPDLRSGQLFQQSQDSSIKKLTPEHQRVHSFTITFRYRILRLTIRCRHRRGNHLRVPHLHVTRHFGGRMMAHKSGPLWASALLASCLLTGLGHSYGISRSLGAGPEAGAGADTKSQRTKSSKTSKTTEGTRVTTRLPRYFASLVDDGQRAELQEIQSGYLKKIMALRQELAELEAAQLKEMESLLTSSQRKALEEMRAGSSKAKTAEKSSSNSKSSGKSSRSSSQSSSARSKGSAKSGSSKRSSK